MKAAILLILFSFNSFALGIYYCVNGSGENKEITAKDKMVYVSKCFFSLTKKKALKACKKDYKEIYSKASKRYIAHNVSAESFFATSQCEAHQESRKYEMESAISHPGALKTIAIGSKTYYYFLQ